MFGVHLSSALYLGPSNESIGSAYSLDPSTGIGSTLFTFGSETVGLLLGGLDEPDFGGDISPPEIISLPNSEFNLQEFNNTKFFEYLNNFIPSDTTNTSIAIPPNSSFSAACEYNTEHSVSLKRYLMPIFSQ